MIKTMIVDDDAVVHVTLRSMTDWESCGYTVVKDCSGGAQALKYLEENSADLLITDIKMPEMSGLELMEQLRRKTSVPVTIVLSGYDEFDLVREAFRLGAYDYLLKSGINKESLTQMLNGLREKVFPNISVSDREYLHMEGLSTDTESDYIAAVFTVSEFSRAAQRFGGNLHERMEKPMLELVRQIRRLQDRAYIRARNPSCYELYYKVEDKNGVKETVLSVVHRIQSVWHDYMNLDTAAGIGYIASSQNTEQAVRCCDTLCKLSVLQGISGVCTHWEHGELAAEYENTAECCDGFITALFDEGSEYASRLDKESGHWFSALSRLNEKAHFRRILILLARLGERLKNYGLSFFEVFPEQTIFFITLK